MRLNRFGRSLLISACLSVSIVPAQDVPPDDANVGIFVRDSAVAAEKMALAERMESARQWDTSAEVFQEVLDGYSDRVIPTHYDAQGRPDRYGSVSTVVQDRISAWPDAGKEEYRSRFELPARRLLEGAGPQDRTALAQVVGRYFITDAGRDAALRLVEIHFDAGEFVAAASLSDRLIDKHPSLEPSQRSLLLLRSALAWRLGGDPVRAQARAQTLANDAPDAEAQIGGTAQSLAAVARAELLDAPVTSSRHAVDRWPVPFGSTDNSAVAAENIEDDAVPREWGRLLSFELSSADGLSGLPEEAQLRGMLSRTRELGAMTGVIPSVDGSQIFFQDNTRIYARDLESGEPLPGWLRTYPSERGQFKVEAVPTPRGAQMAVSLTDRHVLAIVGQMDLQMAAYSAIPSSGAAVVCLNRETGAVVWTRRMNDAVMRSQGNPQAARPEPAKEAPDARAAPRVAPRIDPRAPRPENSFEVTQPSGSVLVVSDAAYFVTRGGQPGSFEDCYLVCLNLADGTPRWTRHLASGSMSSRMTVMGRGARDVVNSHLAYADGRVFVCSDNGAVAAVEAADGSLAWLSIYPRPRQNLVPNWRAQEQQASAVTPAFTGNPVIVRDGRVLVMPSDAEHLFVYDALTGQEVSRVPTKWRLSAGGLADAAERGAAQPQTETSNVLAGTTSEAVVVASPQSVSLLDWNKLRAASGELQPADVLLHRREMRRTGFEDNPIRGRPFVTDKSIYVATAWKLFRFDTRLERAREQYPPVDDWSARPDETPGNILAINGNVIVSGPTRVTVYSGLDLLRRRLDAAIAAQPDAISPRLRYAEAMFNAARFDEALTWIDGAVERLEGRPAGDVDRNSVFEACVGLFRQSMRASQPTPGVPAELLKRLDRTAAMPSQIVSHRLLAAALAQRDSDDAGAVARLQSLIEIPALADLRIRAGSDSVRVAQYAESEIGRIMTARGAAVYGAIETRAQARLREASDSGDVQAMFTVARQFPNSKAATLAVASAGKRLTEMVRDTPSVEQVRALRTDLRRIGDALVNAPEASGVSQALLQSYVMEGNFRAVLGQVRRRSWTDAARPIEGLGAMGLKSSTAGAIVAELQQRAMDEDEASLPDLKARFEGGSFDADQALIKDVSALLLPANPDNARNDRVVVLSRDAGTLRVYEPGKTTPLASVGVLLSRTAVADWFPGSVGDSRDLLVRQEDRVVCVSPDAGSVRWTFELASAPANQLAGGTELAVDASGLLTIAKQEATATGSARPMDPAEAQIRQLQARGQINPAQAQQVLIGLRARQRQAQINGRNIIIGDGSVNMAADWVPDPKPGEQARQQALEQGRPEPDAPAESIDSARVTGQGVVVVTTSTGRIISLDGATGKVLWSQTITDRPIASVKIVDDLVVLATTDESRSRVIVLNAADGSDRLRKTYLPGQQGRVTAVAVDDEGLMVIVQERALSAFDLLGIGTEPYAATTINGQNGLPAFRSEEGSSQAALCGGRLLIFSDGLSETPIVRSFELSTLQPTRVTDVPGAQVIERRYVPVFANNRRSGTERLSLRTHKDRLYLMSGFSMTSYPVLDDGRQTAWSRTVSDKPSLLSTQSPILVKDGLLLVGWPRNFSGRSSRTAMLELYSRQVLPEGREVGMVADELELSHREGNIVDAFQAVDGGFYYLTTEGSLRFLQGIQ